VLGNSGAVRGLNFLIALSAFGNHGRHYWIMPTTSRVREVSLLGSYTKYNRANTQA
jgi:hypothetical protein